MRLRWILLVAGLVVAAVAFGQARQPVTGVDSAALTTGAFGDLATVEPTINSHLSFEYGVVSSELVNFGVDGGSVSGSAPFAVVQSDGGYASFESKKVAHYVPGQGVEFRATWIMEPCTSGSSQAIGMGTVENGYFFACCRACGVYGEPSFAVCRRSGGVDSCVPQASWNLWSAPFYTAPTLGVPGSIKMQWLGYGAVTWSLEDPATGAFRPVHRLNYANTSATPHLLNPTLPLRVEANGKSTVKTPSMSLLRHGPRPPFQVRFAKSSAAATSTGGVNLLTVRVDSTFNSLTNYIPIRPMLLTVANTAAAGGYVTIRGLVNATTTTPSYSAVASNLSVVSADTAGTSPTGGREAFSVALVGGTSQAVDLSALGLTLGKGDTLTLVGTSSTGTPTVAVGLAWAEEQ